MRFTERQLSILKTGLMLHVLGVQPNHMRDDPAVTAFAEREELKINNFLSFLNTLDAQNPELKIFLNEISACEPSGFLAKPYDSLYNFYKLCEGSRLILCKPIETVGFELGKAYLILQINSELSLRVNSDRLHLNANQNWQNLDVLKEIGVDISKINEIYAKNIASNFFSKFYCIFKDKANSVPMAVSLFKEFVKHNKLQLPNALTEAIDTLNIEPSNKTILGNTIMPTLISEINTLEQGLIDNIKPMLLDLMFPGFSLQQANLEQYDNCFSSAKEFVAAIEAKFEYTGEKMPAKEKQEISYIFQSLEYAKASDKFKMELKKILAYSEQKKHSIPIEIVSLLADFHELDYRAFMRFSSFAYEVRSYICVKEYSNEGLAIEHATLKTKAKGFFIETVNNEPLRKHLIADFRQRFEAPLQTIKCAKYIEFLKPKIIENVDIQSEEFTETYIPLLKDMWLFRNCFDGVIFPNQQLSEQFTQEDLLRYLEAASMYSEKTELENGFNNILKDVTVALFQKLNIDFVSSEEILRRIIVSIRLFPYKKELINILKNIQGITDANKLYIDRIYKKTRHVRFRLVQVKEYGKICHIKGDDSDKNAQKSINFNDNQVVHCLDEEQKNNIANNSSQKSIISKIFFIFGILFAVFGIIIFIYSNLWVGIGLIAMGLVLVTLGIYNVYKKPKMEVLNQNTNAYSNQTIDTTRIDHVKVLNQNTDKQLVQSIDTNVINHDELGNQIKLTSTK